MFRSKRVEIGGTPLLQSGTNIFPIYPYEMYSTEIKCCQIFIPNVLATTSYKKSNCIALDNKYNNNYGLKVHFRAEKSNLDPSRSLTNTNALLKPEREEKVKLMGRRSYHFYRA